MFGPNKVNCASPCQMWGSWSPIHSGGLDAPVTAVSNTLNRNLKNPPLERIPPQHQQSSRICCCLFSSTFGRWRLHIAYGQNGCQSAILSRGVYPPYWQRRMFPHRLKSVSSRGSLAVLFGCTSHGVLAAKADPEITSPLIIDVKPLYIFLFCRVLYFQSN